MTRFTFLELAKKVIQEYEKPLTIEEIWDIAKAKGYDGLVGTEGKTPSKTLAARIYVDIRDNEHTEFIKIDTTSPKTFFLKGLVSSEQPALPSGKGREVAEIRSNPSYLEKDLHPLLSYFAYTYLNVYTKTIPHEQSRKTANNQWLHPDIVGVHHPTEDWESEVTELGLAQGGQLTTLYSFELKRELRFANIREAFFQCVSNSSWANEGYLVAAEISGDEEFNSELKRLTTAFGIGIIKLDTGNPDNSEILYPARRKKIIDWETMDKLCKVNPTFKQFVRRIKNELQTRDLVKEHYDPVLELEQLAGIYKGKEAVASK